MSCNKCKSEPCKPCGCDCKKEKECLCDYFIDSLACIRHSGADLECIGATKGDTLEYIVSKIDKKLCEDTPAEDGDSAYEIAVGEGFEGTVEEWLESLVGAPGECECDDPEVYIQSFDRESNSPPTIGNIKNTFLDTPGNVIVPTITFPNAGEMQVSFTGKTFDWDNTFVTVSAMSEPHVFRHYFVSGNILIDSFALSSGTLSNTKYQIKIEHYA